MSVTVPNVAASPLSTAIQTLKDAGLTNQAYQNTAGQRISPDGHLSDPCEGTKPKAGSEVNADAAITVRVIVSADEA
ncbi:MAG: hypothetical protein CMJ83_11820 [Planctomycetes bacterium]|nr:hypothetical protein [Planctomycetota bacterium]